MPIAAKCPSCGASLSETSVLALAPVCEHCRTVITETGGTLGLTSAYGVKDPNITHERVKADLAVFCNHRNKSVGMLEACKEQLNWGVERYAKFPNEPELLQLVEVPPFWESLFAGLGLGVVWTLCVGFGGTCFVMIPIGLIFGDKGFHTVGSVWLFLLWFSWTVPLATRLIPYYKATAANGDRPLENARRQEAYGNACAAARKAAEPIKAAQDHRLRCQIRELEGLIKTYSKKEEDVRGILRTL